MKICFLSDLHLGYNQKSVQYDALEWYIKDMYLQHPNVIVIAGDLTSCGDACAVKRFTEMLDRYNDRVLFIPGDKDMLSNDPHAFEAFSQKVEYQFGDCRIIMLPDCKRELTKADIELLDSADENAFVVMHKPPKTVLGDYYTSWREAHPATKLFYGHVHESIIDGNTHALQSADPDFATNSSPCITYYDSKTNELRQSQYFCPVPNDIYGYLGFSLYSPIEDIRYAIDEKVPNIELRDNAIYVSKDELLPLVNEWWHTCGKSLSVHAPELNFDDDGSFTNVEEWDKFISLCHDVAANRITMHSPEVSITVMKNEAIASKIITKVAELVDLLPEGCIVGVENMHADENDPAEYPNRPYGFVPEEIKLLIDRLSKLTTKKVGANIDTGHARNNIPHCDKYPVGTWLAELGDIAVGYHVHQVKMTHRGIINHYSIHNIYEAFHSHASFLRSWTNGIINKVPVIFEIREKDGFKPTLELFKSYRNKNIFDLHNHTHYSFCGRGEMEDLVKVGIENGIKTMGISDHNYGIGERKREYHDEVRFLAEKYSNEIRLLCGIEIEVFVDCFDFPKFDFSVISDYDYCLVEGIDCIHKVIEDHELLDFCSSIGLPCGIAHYDLFEWANSHSIPPREFFAEMAKRNIFWEMNVRYDSVHQFEELAYVDDFFNDPEKIALIKELGVYVSVGSDCHRANEYPGKRVHDANDRLRQLGILTADELILKHK
ncbi:MAG: PHP domain-containing protein [Clostridiales bacterium]|nr:PHP domain-containing protein [Clostridiales bacterium]